jgi:hypothetical protein
MTLTQAKTGRRRVAIVRSVVVLFAPSRTPRVHATPRRRVARRAVFWGIALLLLAQLGMAVAMETVAPHFRDPEYGGRQFGALKLQRAHSGRPLVLVLGTSRTQNAIDPSSMGFPDEPGSPVVFNAGLSGAYPTHLWLNYHRFCDAGAKPAALLVEIFPATLLATPEALTPLFTETAPRLSYTDLQRLELYLIDPEDIRRRWAVSRVNSWHTLRPVVLGNLAPRWQPPQFLDHHRLALDQFGFTPLPFDTVSDEYRERKRGEMEKNYARGNRTLRVSELSESSFRRLIADCRAEGVPVAFFLTPESPVFNSWYTPESRAAVTAFCRMLTDELGCPVFVAPEEFAEEDFADGHHMLPRAAHRFSRDLADNHLKPWLAQVSK